MGTNYTQFYALPARRILVLVYRIHSEKNMYGDSFKKHRSGGPSDFGWLHTRGRSFALVSTIYDIRFDDALHRPGVELPKLTNYCSRQWWTGAVVGSCST